MKKKIRNVILSVSFLLAFSFIGVQDVGAQDYLSSSDAKVELSTALETGKIDQRGLDRNSVEFIDAEFRLQLFSMTSEYIDAGLSVENAIAKSLRVIEEDSKNYGSIISDNIGTHDLEKDFNWLTSLLTK